MSYLPTTPAIFSSVFGSRAAAYSAQRRLTIDASRFSRRAISTAFRPHQSRAKYASCARGSRPRALAPRLGHCFGVTTVNLCYRAQQSLKSYLRCGWSDLFLRRLLGNLPNEVLIAQKPLIHHPVITLFVTLRLPVCDKSSVSLAGGLGYRVPQLSQNQRRVDRNLANSFARTVVIGLFAGGKAGLTWVC